MSTPRRGWGATLPPGVEPLLRVLLVLVVLAFGVEFVLSLLGWRQRAVPYLLEQRAVPVVSERTAAGAAGPLGFHPTRLFTTTAGFREDAERLGRAATGPWPYRGRPIEPAPRGLPTILVLGDSGVYGPGLLHADTLPAQLAGALERRGFPPERVAVIGYGVPGYTTLQIERLYREEIAAARAPVALVLSTSLWNDRAPATNPVPQRELLEAARPGLLGRVFAGWTARLHWLSWGGDPLRSPASVDALHAAWRRGEPLYGPLVSRSEAVAALRSVVEDAARRSAVVAIVPAHPLRSLAEQPGLTDDVDALRLGLEGAPVELVDGPELLAGSGLSDGSAFLDAVHPSGPWNATLAEGIAARLEATLTEALGPRAETGSGLQVLDVQPSSLSALGDEELTLRVSGLRERDELVVLVGGQPLLDVERSQVGDVTVLRGRVGADRPGPATVLVQSETGVSRAPDPLLRVAPQLQYVPGTETEFPRLVLHSRPGDRLTSLWAGTDASERPAWSVDGDVLLGPGAQELPAEGPTCGPDGRAVLRLEVPGGWPPLDLALQGRVEAGASTPDARRAQEGLPQGIELGRGMASDIGIAPAGGAGAGER